MTNYTYNQNIPNAPNYPGNDQPNMRTNTNSIYSLIEEDHQTFGKDNGGYHKVIHFISQDPEPAAVSLFGQLYSVQKDNLDLTDENLFYLSGGNRKTQLTLNLQPTQNFSGGFGDAYTVLPGGLVLQYGIVSKVSSNENFTVTLPLPYQDTNYLILTSANTTSGTSESLNSGQATQLIPKSKTKFGIFARGTNTNIVYWLTIGLAKGVT